MRVLLALCITLLAPTAVPWFAGWTPDNVVLNRDLLLRRPAKAHAIVLFATTCAPCEAGLRQIAARRADLERAGVDVLLVPVGEPGDTVVPWLAARGLAGLPVLLDPFARTARALGAATDEGGREVLRVPRTVVLAPDGTIRRVLTEDGPDYVDRLIGP
jgi:hypothetical protein